MIGSYAFLFRGHPVLRSKNLGYVCAVSSPAPRRGRVSTWLRVQSLFLHTKWRAWRTRSVRVRTTKGDDGEAEAALSWLFYGASYFFKPAWLLSAAFGWASHEKQTLAERRRVRNIRIFWGVVLALLLGALLLALGRR